MDCSRRGQAFHVLIHHADAQREYACARDLRLCRLDKALDEAGENGWTVVDMQRDWQVIHPSERRCADAGVRISGWLFAGAKTIIIPGPGVRIT